jgi:endonuclease/exonuclease/phosphatase family metal-dependent hydrolase
MKVPKIIFIVAFAFSVLSYASCQDGKTTTGSTGGTGGTTLSNKILVGSFNLQVFGVTKSGKSAVMAILAQIIRHYDVIAVQEIRDAGGTSVAALKNAVNATGVSYDYEIGPRLGRTSSKEQYAFFYNTATIEASPGAYTFNEGSVDTFEREPFIAHFKAKAGVFDFTLVDIHTKPENATAEISFLPNVISEARSHTAEADVICLGDFNADGAYFNESGYSSIFALGTYDWLIGNNLDTTEATSSNTYDRIVTYRESDEDFDGIAGVYRYDQTVSMGSVTPDQVSDHYPVYAEFWTDKDSD